MKYCTTCGETKELGDFHKSKAHSQGRASKCKDCTKKYQSARYKVNREEVLERKKAGYGAKRDKILESKKAYYLENREEIISKAKKYRSENKKKISTQKSKYQRENRHKTNRLGADKRARKRQRTPEWLTQIQKSEIGDFYWLAQDLRSFTGQDYHVDHIVPLAGKNVCGLHVPWNLQVLPADVNTSKGNKHDTSIYSKRP